MRNVIILSLAASGWVATYEGPHATVLQEAFGTDTIPTPFTALTDATKVQAEIARLNPDAEVRVAGEGARLRFADVKAELNGLGVSIRRTGYGHECRVCVRGAGEATAYYTEDLDDALGTGKAMLRSVRS